METDMDTFFLEDLLLLRRFPGFEEIYSEVSREMERVAGGR